MSVLLALLATPLSVRAEPVEARPTARAADRPATSAGRTDGRGSVLDAERAFAADAQRLGQWTAFRKWAAPDATMFVPAEVKAQSWLKDRADPVKAIEWWPTGAWVSRDGSAAVDTGGWRGADGGVGYFTTVWRRQVDGSWRWVLDSGDVSPAIRRRSPSIIVRTAPCTRPSWPVSVYVDRDERQGASTDDTLRWWWKVNIDGSRYLRAAFCGRNTDGLIVDNRVAALTR